jgi:hypothetical protein
MTSAPCRRRHRHRRCRRCTSCAVRGGDLPCWEAPDELWVLSEPSPTEPGIGLEFRDVVLGSVILRSSWSSVPVRAGRGPRPPKPTSLAATSPWATRMRCTQSGSRPAPAGSSRPQALPTMGCGRAATSTLTATSFATAHRCWLRPYSRRLDVAGRRPRDPALRSPSSRVRGPSASLQDTRRRLRAHVAEGGCRNGDRISRRIVRRPVHRISTLARRVCGNP